MAISVLMIIMMNYKLFKWNCQMKNYYHGNNENNDRNHHNNHNNDNDDNYDNDNGDQAIMILFQAMHFGEPFVCEKAEFCESAHILICLHSVKPCLIYRRKLRFLKSYRNESSRSIYKIEEGEVIHIAKVVYRMCSGGGRGERASLAFH